MGHTHTIAKSAVVHIMLLDELNKEFHVTYHHCQKQDMHSWISVHDQESGIYCRIKIKRHPLYYMVNFCIPSLTITFLSVVGSQFSGGAKVQISLTALVGMSILALSISDKLPRTRFTISRFNKFFLAQIAAIVITTLLGQIVDSQLHDGLDRKRKPRGTWLPSFVRYCVLIVEIIVLMLVCLWFNAPIL